MPNHITNVVRFKCETTKEREELSKLFLNEQGNFDFNKIKPMPEVLRNTTSPTRKDDVEAAAERVKETGHPDWYSWSNTEWDTKWNAYNNNNGYDVPLPPHDDPDREEKYLTGAKAAYKDVLANDGTRETIKFDTAWCPPWAVYEELASKYPDLDFSVRYTDEDVPNQSGFARFQGGLMTKHAYYKHNDIDEVRMNWTVDDHDIGGWDIEGKVFDEDGDVTDGKVHLPLNLVFSEKGPCATDDIIDFYSKALSPENAKEMVVPLEAVEAPEGLKYYKRTDRMNARRFLLREERITPWLFNTCNEATLLKLDPYNCYTEGYGVDEALSNTGHAIEAYYTIRSYVMRGLKPLESPSIELMVGHGEAASHWLAKISDLMCADVVIVDDVKEPDFSKLEDVPTIIYIKAKERFSPFWDKILEVIDNPMYLVVLRHHPHRVSPVTFPIKVQFVKPDSPAKPTKRTFLSAVSKDKEAVDKLLKDKEE